MLGKSWQEEEDAMTDWKEEYDKLKNSYEFLKEQHEKTLLAIAMRENEFISNREADVLGENDRLREALELIAAPMRPDGTWNRDRQACAELARGVLKV